jgi:hypothetical protein
LMCRSHIWASWKLLKSNCSSSKPHLGSILISITEQLLHWYQETYLPLLQPFATETIFLSMLVVGSSTSLIIKMLPLGTATLLAAFLLY